MNALLILLLFGTPIPQELAEARRLWGLLPEKVQPAVAVPPWPNFLRGCLKYRESLDRELPKAPVADVEYE